MSDRSIVRDQISRKNVEIQALEKKIEGARVYVRALEDVLRIMERGVSDEDGGDPGLRKGSLVAQARDLILERGQPIYIDDLLVALGKDVTRENKASLAGSLAAYVRKNELFSRPAPSTFGLIELGHREVQEESEPPQDFGSPSANAMDDEIPF